MRNSEVGCFNAYVCISLLLSIIQMFATSTNQSVMSRSSSSNLSTHCCTMILIYPVLVTS